MKKITTITFLILLNLNLSAQSNATKTPEKKGKIYFHLVGLETPIKIFFPFGRATMAGNIGFGYKFNENLGLGLNYGFAGQIDDDFPEIYTGFSLEGRIQNERWITTIGTGAVSIYAITPNDGFYEERYGEGLDLFSRIQIGFRLKKKKPLTVGISLSYCPEVNINLVDFSTGEDTGMRSTDGNWVSFSIFLGIMTF